MGNCRTILWFLKVFACCVLLATRYVLGGGKRKKVGILGGNYNER